MPTNLLLGFCFVLLLQSITRLGLAVQLGFPLLWSLTRKHVWSDVKAGVGWGGGGGWERIVIAFSLTHQKFEEHPEGEAIFTCFLGT